MEMFYFHTKQEENIHLAGQLSELGNFNYKTSTIQWILHLF